MRRNTKLDSLEAFSALVFWRILYGRLSILLEHVLTSELSQSRVSLERLLQSNLVLAQNLLDLSVRSFIVHRGQYKQASNRVQFFVGKIHTSALDNVRSALGIRQIDFALGSRLLVQSSSHRHRAHCSRTPSNERPVHAFFGNQETDTTLAVLAKNAH